MARLIGTGISDFNKLISKNCFYVDKTNFIKEWWIDSRSEVTLIMRPRRFGKTLTLNMVDRFFSIDYAGKSEIFQDLAVWQNDSLHQLQGTYPVISISFSSVKSSDLKSAKKEIKQLLCALYDKYYFLNQSEILTPNEIMYFHRISTDMDDVDANKSIRMLSKFLYKYYQKKVIILLDEYDTPLQEAYINGYWDNLADFFRVFFQNTFKDNEFMERGLLTGVTRVAKENIFSGFNNLKVITATSEIYETSFGFTEEEVFQAMDEFGYTEKDKIKEWYDGFTFGLSPHIYNPWSIINYLDEHKFKLYWANTSANLLIEKLIREGNPEIKQRFKILLQGNTISSRIEEDLVFSQLDDNEEAIWSLLLASGYLKVKKHDDITGIYELALTNKEVSTMFHRMVSNWFSKDLHNYNRFLDALLKHDLDSMNDFMNALTKNLISYFDSGTKPSEKTEPEKFYHGLVLGLIATLEGKYFITSNRESGYGRYDIMLEPLNSKEDAIIMEFKVFDPKKDKNLHDTAAYALTQIKNEHYDSVLFEKGFRQNQIHYYGFAFKGKEVFIESW